MNKMRKVFVCIVGIAFLATCGSAFAGGGKTWDDLSWWAQSGATRAPVQDATRSGYWWIPSTPVSNVDDAELWGNRGVIYGMYAPPAPPPPPPPEQPEEPEPPEEPPEVVRVIPVLNNVLFDFDKSVLKAEGKDATAKVIEIMEENEDDTLLIEGHTCDVGPEAYNEALGQRRADSIKGYMVDNDIDEDRISTVSLGEDDPAVPNNSPDNRKLNRRAVFKLKMAD